MSNKYLNEAIIGNQSILATFTSKGELQRLYFPNKDNRQYISFYHTGVQINGSDLIYLHEDINNTYKQYYEPDTNILNTEVTNSYFNLKVLQTDFVPIKENVLIRKYTFINDSKIDLDINFYIHSELLSDKNNLVGSKVIDRGVMQYAHDYVISTFTKQEKIFTHQLNGSKEKIKRCEITDKDYIGMSKDASIAYKVGEIHPNEKKELVIYILIDENKNVSSMEDEVDRITRLDVNKEYTNTKSYWQKYVKNHHSLNLKEGKNYTLRIVIDNENGISIDDCEKVNNEITGLLDSADYIKDQYFLEVSSPGLERNLRKDWQLKKYIDSNVNVSLFRKDENGFKEYNGILKDVTEDYLTISRENEEYKIPRKKIAQVKTIFEF